MGPPAQIGSALGSAALAALWCAIALGCGGAAVAPADGVASADPDPPAEAAAAHPPDDPSAAAPAPRRRASGAREVAGGDADRTLAISRRGLDRAIAAGPGWLLGQVPLEPVRDRNKKFIGFRVVSVFGDTPLALSYGVRPGDRLVRVQGKAIVVPSDLVAVLELLKLAEFLEIVVERGGAELELRWPIR